MENNVKSALDPEIQNLMNGVKEACPTKKLNLTIDTTQGIAGMYLITLGLDKMNETLDQLADMSNLEDTTWLFFDRRHVCEITLMLYGALAVFSAQKIIDKNIYRDIIYYLITGCTGNAITWQDFKLEIEELINDIENELAKDILRCFMQKIWFLPFNAIDTLGQRGIDEYQKDNCPTGYVPPAPGEPGGGI